MKIKGFAQKHNVVPRPGLEPEPLDPESSTLTIRPPSLAFIVLEYVQFEAKITHRVNSLLTGTSMETDASLRRAASAGPGRFSVILL